MNEKKKTLLSAVSLIIALPLIIAAIIMPPKKTEALSIFTPFGGKVLTWLPVAPGCAVITAAVSVATLGTVNITVEELVVGGTKGGTFGILRVNGLTIPVLTTIYDYRTYMIPGVNVIGNSINVCDVCGKAEDIPGVGAICKLPGIKEVLDIGCDAIGAACPVTNLVHKIGSSLKPSF